jgi:hypothetical protein
LKRVVVTILGLLIVPVSASAETFTADFLRVGNAQAVKVVKNGIGRSVWAGELIWNGYDPAPDGFGGDFYSYCVDLITPLEDPQTFEIKSAASMPVNGAQVAWLASGYAPAIHSQSGGAANAMAAGLQLAIWNVLYDNDFTLPSGNLHSSSLGAASHANADLAALSAALNAGPPTARAIWLDTDRGQDQVTVSVPEPAVLLLLGIGLAGIAAGRRRFGIS